MIPRKFTIWLQRVARCFAGADVILLPEIPYQKKIVAKKILENAKVGKKYAEAAKLIDRSKAYSIEEAVKLAKETNIAKFDASVDCRIKV